MEQVHVDVFVPGINKHYDVILSLEMSVGFAAEYIFKTICEYDIQGIKNGEPILCDSDSKKVLDENLTLKECDIGDASSLILL